TLIAERITGRVEYIQPSREMTRGTLDEPYARAIYAEHYAPVTEVGFIVNDDHGFKMGYSPDGLAGDDGLIEIKSRSQRIQLQTVLRDEVPAGNMAQMQMGMLVTGRKWCDYISYSGGMALYVKRVFPDPEWFAVIIEAVSAFEKHATEVISKYLEAVANRPATEYIEHFPETEFTF
ncbi:MULTISPECIES: lambda exonuclease family protein, partial [Actinomycetes]|uniref:lambda exonuclease family protein n=1 Tax=Actinomycetes TaxID=1760 RepID=UPI00342D37BD